MPRKTLNVPPFPPLRWNDFGWEGKVTLPSWAGFRANPSSSRSRKLTDGTVRLNVAVEDEEEQTPPTPAQINAMQHLLDNESAVAEAALQAILQHYPQWKAEYEADFDAEGALPDVSDTSGLRPLLKLVSVHVLYVAKSDTAYLGFGFDCIWDGEHGAGVMTHLGRIVEVGQADCSFLEWIAEQDARRRKKK